MFSEDTRHYLVRMVVNDGESLSFAELSLRVSKRSATRYLEFFRDTDGAVPYDLAMSNRHRGNIRDDPLLRDAVQSAVNEHPELSLDEMAVATSHMAGVVDPGVGMSVSSMGHVLAHCGYTPKIIERANYTRNEAQRAADG